MCDIDPLQAQDTIVSNVKNFQFTVTLPISPESIISYILVALLLAIAYDASNSSIKVLYEGDSK